MINPTATCVRCGPVDVHRLTGENYNLTVWVVRPGARASQPSTRLAGMRADVAMFVGDADERLRAEVELRCKQVATLTAPEQNDEPELVNLYKAGLGDHVVGVCNTCSGPLDEVGGSIALADVVRDAAWPEGTDSIGVDRGPMSPGLPGPDVHLMISDGFSDVLLATLGPDRAADLARELGDAARAQQERLASDQG